MTEKIDKFTKSSNFDQFQIQKVFLNGNSTNFLLMCLVFKSFLHRTFEFLFEISLHLQFTIPDHQISWIFFSSKMTEEEMFAWIGKKKSSTGVDPNGIDFDRLLKGTSKTTRRNKKLPGPRFIWNIVLQMVNDAKKIINHKKNIQMVENLIKNVANEAVEIVEENEFFDGPFDDDIKKIMVDDAFLPGFVSDDGKEQLFL